MFKHVVYIEKSLSKNSAVKNIITRLSPEHIIYINNYKEVLNQTNSSWTFNKAYQKIILAKREDEFYYKGSYLTSSLNHPHFYYNTLALNCLYHCEYCYLQGMYNTPHLVLFLNNHDFIRATKNLLLQLKDKIYLALSYDTDLPALETYYPYCQEWIDFANKEKNLTIEIRTKSYQLSFLDDTKPSANVILSFTLSPEEIQKKYEPFTPSLKQRLKGIQKAINKGYSIMLCFDPLIYTPDFKKIYSRFFESIFSKIASQDIYAVSIGVFRMNNDFFKSIRKNGNTMDIYFYRYEIKNKVITYSEDIKNEMITFVKQELSRRGIEYIFVYE